MKKTKLFIALILSFILISVGCSETSNNNESKTNNVDEAIKEEVIKDENKEEPTKEKEENNFDNWFDKTKNMDAYYYEVNSDITDGTSYTTKVWYSENKTKMESKYVETGEKIIMIMDSDEDLMYIYMAAENMAMKMKLDDDLDFTNENDQMDSQDYIEIMKELADDESVSVENATLDGESVKIVTGEIEGNINKIWISNSTGFPLKSEFYMNGVLESTATFTSFEETSIDSSIFTLPADVEIQDMTSY